MLSDWLGWYTVGMDSPIILVAQPIFKRPKQDCRRGIEYAFESNVISTDWRIAIMHKVFLEVVKSTDVQLNAAYLTQKIKFLPSFYSLSLLRISPT